MSHADGGLPVGARVLEEEEAVCGSLQREAVLASRRVPGPGEEDSVSEEGAAGKAAMGEWL